MTGLVARTNALMSFPSICDANSVPLRDTGQPSWKPIVTVSVITVAWLITVALIPHTLAVTTLGLAAPGRRLNVEADVIARYVERSMERSGR